MNSFAPLFIGMDGTADALTSEAVGSKAALLARMGRLGLPVPPAFVLPTALCAPLHRKDRQALAALGQGLNDGIARLEQATGRRFGDVRAPLLVSVRSGAAQSMPGMLATVLDVGLNEDSVHGLIGLTGNPRLAWDSYRRFIQNFAEVVDGVAATPFDACLAAMVRSENVGAASDLDPEALERLTHEFRAIAARESGRKIPADPMDQLAAAAQAVYRSWDGSRARDYRRLNHLDDRGGTAVTVQAMVFGNAGGNSGAGVAFTRNPATGAKELYVDFLFDAQGEDIVAGRRLTGGIALLAARLPRATRELADGAARLEREFHDVQDIEFTVERGTLFFLQTRTAKRSPRAALRILVDLVHEGLVDPVTASTRAAEIDLDHLRIMRFSDRVPAAATAISASPGVAVGRAAFDSVRAQTLAAGTEPVILVRHDTSTDDVAGFAVADGILTAAGSRTAHAAVVARQLGKVCLVGCRDLTVHANGRYGELAGKKIEEGDWLSLDGDNGEVAFGRRAIVTEIPEAELAEIATWRQRREAS
jgi:pyruvate, orthophosphate dikinase